MLSIWLILLIVIDDPTEFEYPMEAPRALVVDMLLLASPLSFTVSVVIYVVILSLVSLTVRVALLALRVRLMNI